MKRTSLFMALCLMLFTLASVSAQNSTSINKELEFKVTGNCSMCKKTIEASLQGKPGVSSAEWNKDSKIMKMAYDPAKITEEKIHEKIANSGYDTEKKKASDKAYTSLPGCCQYKRTLHN